VWRDLQLVIFDCDGVLVDSEAISSRVLADVLGAEGLSTTPTQARAHYQGMLLADIASQAEKKLGHRLSEDWLVRFDHQRESAFRRELKPVPGAAEAVQRVTAAGIKACVASQGRLSKTRLTLALTGLDELFPDTARFSAYQVARGKPAPDLFLHAAGSMGAPPTACLVVEDTPSGVIAAVSAGMRALGYSTGSDGRALREAGATGILSSMGELPGVVGLS